MGFILQIVGLAPQGIIQAAGSILQNRKADEDPRVSSSSMMSTAKKAQKKSKLYHKYYI
jgi:hypothetical protein